MSNKSRKDVIKNIAIIFLSIMLVLTFFSNTILNWSLPQVGGRYTEYGEIKTGIRGSGSVQSNMTYTESVKGLRTVEAVYVNRGSQVQKGDLLMLFSATDAEGIEALEAEIASMQEAYDRAILGKTEVDYSSDELTIKNAEEDLNALKEERALYTDEYVAKRKKAVEDAEAALTAAEENVEALEEQLDEISESSNEPEIVSARATLENQQTIYDKAVKDYEDALEDFEKLNFTDVESLEAQLESLEEQRGSLKTELKYLKEDYSDVLNLDSVVSSKKSALDKAKKKYDEALKKYQEELESSGGTDGEDPEAPKSDAEIALEEAQAALDKAQKEYDDAVKNRDENADETKAAKRAVQQKNSAINSIEDEISEIKSKISLANLDNHDYENKKEDVENKKIAAESEKRKLDDATESLENAVKKYSKSTTEQLKAARKELEAATESKTEADAKLRELDAIDSLDDQIKSAERSLESMKLSLERRKESDSNSNKLEEYDLKKQLNAIYAKRKELNKLKEGSSEGYELRATHAGTVTEINFRAGEIASDGSAAVVIEVVESGYTLSFSVSNTEAMKVNVGDTATVSDTYWGQNVGAVLKSIIPDAGGKTKTLTFELSGNVEAGQNLTILVGEKSTGYSSVIPKSALREDSKGKFIYITKTKSTPLGNRYVATRLDVRVAAEDDKNVAITTDETYLYEYVIVSSTKPFEEGDYVRLSE